MNYRSYIDLVEACRNVCKQLPPIYKEIISIPRSGNIPSSIIALHLNIPWSQIDFVNHPCSYSGRIAQQTGRTRYLLVDDSCHTGTRIRTALENLKNKGITEVDTLAIYLSPEQKTDYYYEIVNQPRAFEWNLFNHTSWLSSIALDIDGVVCPDPKIDEVLNERGYIECIKNAPCIRPIAPKVAAFVTSRLEKYRDVTEEWLGKNGFSYNKLVMSPHKTAQERRSSGSHGLDKAKVYQQNPSWILFIESESGQASQIHKITNKPVLCTDTNFFFKKV